MPGQLVISDTGVKQYVTTGATTYTPANTLTPIASSLLICFVNDSTTDTSETDPTSVSLSGGLTFTKIATTQFISGIGTTTVWVADVGTNTGAAQSLTVSGWGTSRTGVSIALLQATGADMTGGASNAILNIHVNTGTALSGSVTLSAASSIWNRPVGFFNHVANELPSAGTNWTLGSNGSYQTPSRGSGYVYRNDVFDTGPNMSWATSAQWWGYGFELKAMAPNQPDVAQYVTPMRASYR